MPRSAGFTLIEVLIVVGLFALTTGLGLVIGMQSYRNQSFRGERDALVTALVRARSQAIHSMCFGPCTGGAPHGVHLDIGEYVLFQGTTYETRYGAADERLRIEYLALATTTPSATDIVFSPRAGTTTEAAISLVDASGTGTSTITVNAAGQISWTQ